MIEELGITASEVESMIKNGDQLFFVDVRHHQDWDWAVLKARGALRVNDDQVDQNVELIPRERTVIVYSSCVNDERSCYTARLLQERGWQDAHYLVGGFNAYCEEGLPVEDIGSGSATRKIMLL